MADNTWLVAGLGNPGTRYQGTRHNIGQVVLDELLERMGARYTRTKVGAKAVGARLGDGGPKVVFAISEGYMNVSGRPIRKVMDYFSVPPQQLVVVHDELDLDFGRLKLKRGGSEGGHNGLKSITEHLGGDREYIRLRVGIGRPPGRMDSAAYVLQNYSAQEMKELPEVVGRAADAVESVLLEGLAPAQNKFH
ncbi:aminoacyl-tRNA hydrolase [Nesterenkonia natronophila]|uniref:Peptidyl-tRNA hydrolase n=1 Tax=Nesterenkonia natronophila TaxID=2174932 RepID=A0A3A4FID7_9MICC|nr:aminoacyl-tRNA hydrolase [Nesterenkonia natronophila]RJN32095.1 aminoacyl-tRNA hydrolase [Nesterenkonia natronophila]